MNSESVIAIVRIVVPAVCGVLGVLGIAVDAEAWTSVALVLAGAACSLWSGWKNNNVTEAAQSAQQVLDGIKAGTTGVTHDGR